MKKSSRLLKVSGILLVLTLITSCFVGGTFAKYISENKGEDSARVAMWGVEVSGAGGAFSSIYTNNNDKITVSSTGSATVVAPGTSGTFKGITLSGTPEVAVRIDTEATIGLENWTVSSGFYCPLKFYINDVLVDTSKCSSAQDFIDTVEKAIEDVTNDEEISPGTNLANALSVLQADKIRWEWPFNGDDTKDTELGNAAASGQNVPTVSLMLKTTVTQID